MRREGKFTKCDQGLTSHEAPSGPSGVCSSWKNQKGSSASPRFSLWERKTPLAEVWPETTLPFGTTAPSRGSGDHSEVQQGHKRQGMSDALQAPGTVPGPRTRATQLNAHNSTAPRLHTQATGKGGTGSLRERRTRATSRSLPWVRSTPILSLYLPTGGCQGTRGASLTSTISQGSDPELVAPLPGGLNSSPVTLLAWLCLIPECLLDDITI